MALAFTPDTMKSVLNMLGGPAIPSQYLAVIRPPNAMLFGAAGGPLSTILSIGGAAILSVLTKDVSIPGRAMLTQDVAMHGTFRKLPYAHSHEVLKMQFICSNSMLERTFFDTWLDFIQTPGSHYMEYFDDFKGEIWIKKLKNSGLDKTLAFQQPDVDPPIAEIGSALSFYRIEEAFPAKIYAQELTYGTSMGGMPYLTLDIEFYYTRFTTTINQVMPLFNSGSHDSPTGLARSVPLVYV